MTRAPERLSEGMEGLRCPGVPGMAVKAVWEALEPAERQALLDTTQSGAYIAAALTRWGHPIGATSIKDWRRTLVRDSKGVVLT